MDSIDLGGAVAIVTGASQGLGKAMAIGLAEAGARVVLTSIDKPNLDLVADEIGRDKALPILADITSEGDCDHVVQQSLDVFGEISALINNARRTTPHEKFLFWESPVEFWESSVRINIFGTYLMTRSVIPQMMKQRSGRVINISTSIDTMQRKYYSPYGVTKAAIDAETLIWAQDLEATGITVNTLIPGSACDTREVRSRGSSRGGSLLPPAVMVPPLVWLVSKFSEDATGGRYVAKNWNAAIPPSQAAKNCIEAPIFRSPSTAS